MAVKITKSQADVLSAILDGEWELDGGSVGGGARLQRGGLGRGGESKAVHTSTVEALRRRGLVRLNRGPDDPFWRNPCVITPEGIAALEAWIDAQ